LHEISQRLNATLPQNALLSRLGGDEFCCLLRASEGEKAFLRVGGAVLKELRRPVIVDSYDLSVSASIGLSMAETAGVTFDELLRKADLALFDAKGRGGNAVRVFRPELAERSHRFLQVDTELREALARNRLELFYQPRISAKTGKIVAAEALIRLNSPSGASVLPDEFIPVAEATGCISAIGRWVLREAARHLVILRNGGAGISLSVNVSPRQFADPSFLALLRQLRPTIDAAEGDIELEITENILIESNRRLQRVLMQISDLGYKLAIDDFGTAYSNLASLTRYPISCIKIDRTLIAHKDFRLLVTGVMTIARAFGARIVAEGVETEVQRQWLQDNHCDEFQGYLFSRPVPFAELVRMVAETP
jgi:EAL domain-containing protein (putative c-di-GMP-specific phosphodiesterase class I)